MEIRVLKITEYMNCPIMVQNFGQTFQYITLVQGKFYSGTLESVIPLFQRLIGKTYTKKQLEDATRMILTMAQATVKFAIDGDMPIKK